VTWGPGATVSANLEARQNRVPSVLQVDEETVTVGQMIEFSPSLLMEDRPIPLKGLCSTSSSRHELHLILLLAAC